MLPSEEQELVQLVNKNLQDWQRRTFVYEKQWWMNLAFFLGEHWIKYSEIEKKLITPKPKEKARVRLKSNHVASMILTLLAKMTANEPAMGVIPNTESLEDKQAARLGNQIMKWLWKHIEMPDLIEELVQTLLIFGMDYLKVWWDPLAEESFSIQSLDQLGKPFEEEIHLGQVASEVVPPFALAIDPLARTFRQAKWVIQSSIRSVEEVLMRTGKKVEPEKVSTPIESKLLSLYSGLQGKELPSEVENATSWKEYWDAPSDKFKSGRLAIVAGGELVYGGENPYSRIPFFPFPMIRVPGRVLGKSLIEDVIPLQKGYNRSISIIVENMNKMAKLKWMVPRKSVSEGALTDESGEVVEYLPIGGQKPEQSQVNPLPQYVIYVLEKYLKDMEDLMGVHEVSRSRPPGGVRAGVALAYLREGDDSRIGPVVRRIDQGLEQAASFMLELVGKYYTEPRLIRLVGKEQAVEVRNFKGADLKNNYDVRIEAGSALAESKVGKQELLLNLWDRRILTDAQDILERLEFGEVEVDSTKDAWKAHAENSLMSQGQVPEVVYQEDHQAHLQVHIDFMRTPIFYNLDPNVQNLFTEHIRVHQQFMVQAAQPQPQPQVAEQSQIMGGPTGEPPMMGMEGMGGAPTGEMR